MQKYFSAPRAVKGRAVSPRAFLLLDMSFVLLASLLAVAARNSSLGILVDAPNHLLYAGVSAASALVVWASLGISRRVWQYFSVSDMTRLLIAITATVVVAVFLMFTINRSDFVGDQYRTSNGLCAQRSCFWLVSLSDILTVVTQASA